MVTLRPVEWNNSHPPWVNHLHHREKLPSTSQNGRFTRSDLTAACCRIYILKLVLFQGKNRKAGVNLGPYGACGEIAARHRDPLGILNLLNSHPTLHLFQRGQLHRDRLRPAGPDLGGPLPAGGSQPVAHQEHGQHARLAAGRRQPSFPPAFPQQPLGRKSHHDPGDGVAVSAFF